MVKVIKGKCGKRKKIKAIVELVHSMPRDGVASSFKFGCNYGQWLGILTTLNIPYALVSPQKWQKYYGPLPKDKSSRKRKLKTLAQELYPELKVTLKTADAILIAHYGRQSKIKTTY